MTIDAFIQKYQGKKVPNNNGDFVGECVSLAIRYATEVQQVPDGVLYCSTTGGARDLYEQYDGQIPKFYTRIPYGEPFIRGDLIIWGINRGKYGHVAIALDEKQVFEQLGTPDFVPARISTQKAQPLGYLRLKEGVSMLTLEQRDEFISYAYNNIGGRAPTDDDFNFHRHQFDEEGDVWALKLIKGFEDNSDVEWKKQAAWLAQVAQAAGLNPDHQLGQADADKIVALIDAKNKQIEALSSGSDPKLANLGNAIKDFVKE